MHRKILLELKLNKRARNAHSLQENTEPWETSYEDHLVGLQSSEEWKEKMQHAFQQLTDRQKELLRLRFFEDRDYDSIAVECGITRRTAYNIVHEALKVLRAELLLSAQVPQGGELPDLMVVFLLAGVFFSS